MNKISKNYLKGFIKDILISGLTILYLIFMFILIFSMSASSIQYFSQYQEMLSKSNKWESSYNDFFNKWNFKLLGENTNSKNSSDYNTFNLFNDLKFNNINLLKTGWYKIICNEIGIDSSINDPIDITNINGENYLERFNQKFSLIMEQLSLFQYTNDNQEWANALLIDTTSNNVLSDIFNPDENIDWSVLNYSLSNALNESMFSNSNNIVTNTVGFNQSIQLKNYYAYASKNTIDVNHHNSSLITPTSQVLNITFTDNDLRKNMSQVYLQKNTGILPKKDNEILVNKYFANQNHWKIGDEINLFGYDKSLLDTLKDIPLVFQKFKIVGYGMSLSTSESPNMENDDSSIPTTNTNYSYGNIYTTYNEYKNIKKDIYDSYANYLKDNEFLNGDLIWSIDNNPYCEFDLSITGNTFLSNNSNYYDQIINEAQGKNYFSLDKSSYIGKKYLNSDLHQTIKTNQTSILTSAAMVIIILGFSFIFLNLIIKRDINNSKRQLGIFKAMGYTTKNLSWIYSYKVFITFIFAAIIGYLISIPIQILSTSFTFKSIVILTITKFNYLPTFLIMTLLFIPLLFTIISFLLNLYYIKKPPIELIYSTQIVQNKWLLNTWKKVFFLSTKVGKLKIAFTVQSLYKWIIILIIILFSTASLIMNSSIILSMNDNLSNNILANIYTDAVKTTIPNENLRHTILDTTNSKMQTQYDVQKNNSPFAMVNPNDASVQQEITSSTTKWNENIDNKNWITLNITQYPYIYLGDLFKIYQSLISVDAGFKNPDIQSTLQNLNILNNHSLYGDKTVICFNKIMYGNTEKNYNVMKNYLTSPLFAKSIDEPVLRINGLAGQANKTDFKKFEYYFLKNNITNDDYNNVINYDSNSNEIPVIITSKLSKFLHWKVNDVISYKSTDIDNIGLTVNRDLNVNQVRKNISLKIVAVSQNDYSTLIFTGYNNLAKFYEDINKIDYYNTTNNVADYSLLNSVMSQVNTFPNCSSLKDVINLIQNQTKTKDIDMEYFSICINENLDNFLNTSQTIINFFQIWNNDEIKVGYTDFTNMDFYPQLKSTLNSIYGVIQVTGNIQIIFMFILVGILILISLALIIDENKRVIIMLKVLGYKIKTINWITTGNTILIIILSLTFSIIIAYFILQLLQNILWTKYFILIELPLAALSVIQISLYVLVVAAIIWTVCTKLIMKNQINELSKFD